MARERVMTEKVWESCKNPEKMLRFVLHGASPRKLRLFACACVRLYWHLLTDERSRQAVEMAERYAERQSRRKELDAARQTCAEMEGLPEWHAGHQVCVPSASSAASMSVFSSLRNVFPPPKLSVPAAEAGLLRDVFSPFRPLHISPDVLAWQDATVVKLARAAYDQRQLPSGLLDATRLAVLADALQDAGCTEEWLAAHLRVGQHVRGCAVVDLLTGRT
jgi:hypothetical protein